MVKRIYCLFVAVLLMGAAIFISYIPNALAEEAATTEVKIIKCSDVVAMPVQELEPKEPEQIKIDTPYEDEALYIKQICEELEYENWQMAFAIARLESGNFKTLPINHNWGGLSVNEKPITYQDNYEGCVAFVKLLKKYEQYNTPEELGKIWCPVNNNWASLVSQLMNETKISKEE